MYLVGDFLVGDHSSCYSWVVRKTIDPTKTFKSSIPTFHFRGIRTDNFLDPTRMFQSSIPENDIRMHGKVIFQNLAKGHIPESSKRSYFAEYDLFLHFDFQEGPQSGLFFLSSTAKFLVKITWLRYISMKFHCDPQKSRAYFCGQKFGCGTRKK